MEKRSKALLIVLRESFSKRRLLFDEEFYGKAVESSPNVNPLIGTQNKLNERYIIDFEEKWDEYIWKGLKEDLKPQINFLHSCSTNKLIFNAHYKGVLNELESVREQNINTFKKVGYDSSFSYLNYPIRFCKSLQDCDWQVDAIDLSLLNFNISSDPFHFVKEEFFNDIFSLLFKGKLDTPIHLKSFIEEYKKECKISIYNLLGKSGDDKKHYQQILKNNFNQLKNYGFFIKKNDEFQPTIFLRILRDIKLKSFSPFMVFNVLLEDLDGIANNYCEIVEGCEFSEVRIKIEEYLRVIIECNKASYCPSEYKSAHKLAESKSRIKLFKL